ncbi:MAG: aminotransferase class I/II-fold pyridoxal phosphate-dependent enzyme, partial [Halobacteria archaeon]|nr:aminotransferase class I/II-fold pyridoxal phosphate-dependent enzyme [Halobacteria archaeon]
MSHKNKLFATLKGTHNPSNMVELVQRRAEGWGDQTVYTFLTGNNDNAGTLTFAQLELHARALGARLQAEGASGRPVILLCPPGIDYIVGYWGCLFAGAIAVPAYPPDPKRLARMLPRIQAIVEDCQPSVALATTPIIALKEEMAAATPVFGDLSWVAIDQLDLGLADQWRDPNAKSNTLAFLQYTSGSTSTPKGVMVSHGNLVHNSKAIFQTCNGRNSFVSWLPPYHDMGLIGTIIQVVYSAGWGHFMAPMTFLRQPFRWLETLTRTRASISVAPNFAYEQCVKKISDAQLTQLDLSDWNQAFCGAEPVRWHTIDAFCERFAAAGFRRGAFLPCYGLAEGTLQVSGWLPKEEPRCLTLNQRKLEQRQVVPTGNNDPQSVTAVSCGKPVDSTRVVIVDPDSHRPCRADQVGEIWVSSPSCAQGYWQRPEASAKTFNVPLIGVDDADRFMRTGDLGFLDEQGELYVAGRVKDVIVFRGRNLYPEDLETASLRAYPDLRAGGVAAFSIELAGQEEVVLVQEVEGKHRQHTAQILAAIRSALAGDTLEVTPYAVLLVRSGSLPKTSSGKIQRSAAREAFLNMEFTVLAASVLADSTIREGKSDVTAPQVLRQALAQYSPDLPIADTRLVDIGIDFPTLHQLKRALEKQLLHAVPMGSVLASPTIAGLLKAAGGDPEQWAKILAPAPRQTTEKIEPCRWTVTEIERWMVDALATRLGLEPSVIDMDAPFADIGLDSSSAVDLAAQLSEFLQQPVSPTLVWERPSLRAAARYLAEEGGANKLAKETTIKPQDEPIAIIGMGCRFPGAADPESFWKLLQDGRDAITQVPAGRWQAPEDLKTADGQSVSPWGGFLEHIDQFDPQFFGLSQREAERMDPQQRLLLEVSCEALEGASLAPRRLAGSATGVFVGISNQDYWTLQTQDSADLDIHACTGNSSAVAANRISYTWDLRGPSLAVDTACSSSLVALHLACEALRRNDCSLALAGGVNLMVTPDLSIAFTRARMLSPEGRCRTFDEGANGYVRGEGCGLLVLARLSDAQRNGYPIVATIAGSAVQHDGRSNGLTAPNGDAQEVVIRRALEASSFAASDVDYIEAHGTGTRLGDPIEACALASIYGAGREPGNPCLIGSAKTNIGHLEAAAGIAGVMKAALSLKHSQIPPQLHCHSPSSIMDWQNSGLQVIQQAQPWQSKSGHTRKAAVSSFGFGGTIAHVLLQEAPPVTSETRFETSWQILPLSAHKSAAMDQQLMDLAQHLRQHPELSLDDCCSQVALQRSQLRQRLALVAEDRQGMIQALEQAVGRAPRVALDRSGTAFCFTGQGSQYVAMAQDLINTEPVFREVIQRCDRLAQSQIGMSLVGLLTDNVPSDQLEPTQIQQPLIFALQCGLAELWRSWGVEPDVVLGHSLGEYAAAVTAGMLTLGDGMTLVLARAHAMAQQDPAGGMLACIGDVAQIKTVLPKYTNRLWVAAYNSPSNIVLSGSQDAIDEFCAQGLKGVNYKPLRVANAFHSPLMQDVAPHFRDAIAKVTLLPPRIPLFTSLHGEQMDTAPTHEHFIRHLLEPVDYQAAVTNAAQQGCRRFIEIGPGNTLLSLGKSCLAEQKDECQWLPSLMPGQSNRAVLRKSLAEFWNTGGKVDWQRIYPGRVSRTPPLPNYPYCRTRCWHVSAPTPTRSETMDRDISAETQQYGNLSTPEDTQTSSLIATLELFRSQNATLQRLAAGMSLPEAPVTAQPQPTVTPVVTSAARIQEDIVAQLARISGIPSAEICLDQRLGTQLGLDSLMYVELDRALVKRWPALAEVDRTVLAADPAVADVVDLVCKAQGVEPAQIAPVVAVKPPQETVEVEAQFEDSEEYQALMQRLQAVEATGANPYGRIHQGFNGAHAKLDDKSMLNFAAFNYCGLSNHPRVMTAAKVSIDTYGTSPSATPLLFGETPLHRELETEIADFMGTEAAVVFASGHATSVAVIGHIMDKTDLVIHDQYIHDCAIRGAILSGARRRSFRHDDWEELDRTLSQIRSQFRRVLIVIEGVYSQDGDLGSLPEFIRIKKKHKCMLMIDEAHSIGTLGAT